MMRRLQVKLAVAEARVAAAESNEAAAIEDLKESKEQHVQELRDAHLVGRARRRMRDFPGEEPPILDGILVIHGNSKRKSPETPPAPPPPEAPRESPEVVEPSPEQSDMLSLLIPLEDHSVQGEDSPRDE
jgi:hypothetical protein